MDGDLVARSEEGQGAEFILTLPRGALARASSQ
jgi:signal transduction histidine kinase